MSIYDYAIPVSPKRTVYIQGPWPLTADEWQNFENVLSLFKPGLVTEPARIEAMTDRPVTETPQPEED